MFVLINILLFIFRKTEAPKLRGGGAENNSILSFLQMIREGDSFEPKKIGVETDVYYILYYYIFNL